METKKGIEEMKKCLNCGKYFIPWHITVDNEGVHPAGSTCCSIRCTEAYYHIAPRKARRRK